MTNWFLLLYEKLHFKKPYLSSPFLMERATRKEGKADIAQFVNTKKFKRRKKERIFRIYHLYITVSFMFSYWVLTTWKNEANNSENLHAFSPRWILSRGVLFQFEGWRDSCSSKRDSFHTRVRVIHKLSFHCQIWIHFRHLKKQQQSTN